MIDQIQFTQDKTLDNIKQNIQRIEQNLIIYSNETVINTEAVQNLMEKRKILIKLRSFVRTQ